MIFCFFLPWYVQSTWKSLTFALSNLEVALLSYLFLLSRSLFFCVYNLFSYFLNMDNVTSPKVLRNPKGKVNILHFINIYYWVYYKKKIKKEKTWIFTQYTNTDDFVLIWHNLKMKNGKYLQILKRTYFSNYFIL